jgi:hypothetical protein
MQVNGRSSLKPSQKRQLQSKRSGAPPVDFVKINTDAAFSEASQSGGWGRSTVMPMKCASQLVVLYKWCQTPPLGSTLTPDELGVVLVMSKLCYILRLLKFNLLLRSH